MVLNPFIRGTSQSPQAGQFNSYLKNVTANNNFDLIDVSIPSSGSIQFLPEIDEKIDYDEIFESQSPQAGQFNSYPFSSLSAWLIRLEVSIPSSGSIQFLQERDCQHFQSNLSLNPLKRVNSILTCLEEIWIWQIGDLGLNPLKRVNSILTIQFICFDKPTISNCLNPLKRVNSILTVCVLVV